MHKEYGYIRGGLVRAPHPTLSEPRDDRLRPN